MSEDPAGHEGELQRLRWIEAAARRFAASVAVAEKDTLRLRTDESGSGHDAFAVLLIALDDSADGARLRAAMDEVFPT